MEIKKSNIKYKVPAWITICNECESELTFTKKDTHLFINNSKKEYYIQCPYCGNWLKIYTLSEH